MGFGIDSSHRLEHLGARARSGRERLAQPKQASRGDLVLEESLIRRELGESFSPSLLTGIVALAARAARSIARLVA